jgi:TonB family protein
VASQGGGLVQQLEVEQKKAAVATPSRWFPPMEQLPDSGEIDSHHALLTVLNRIYSGRLTGKLQLVFGRFEKQLFFDGGQVVFATSSDRQDSLGDMMLRVGALTQGQFEEASLLVKTGQRFGSAIAEMGIYGVEEVITWVQRQLIHITESVLDYRVGRYYFFGSLERNVVPEIVIPLPLGKLLLEAVHKANDLPLDHLAEDADLRVDFSPDPLLLFQAVDLEENERHLLGLISPPISAKDIISRSGLSKAQAARALYALLLLGFVVGVPGTERLKREPAVPIPPPAPEVPHSDRPEDKKRFEEEIRRLLEVAEKGTYYDLFGLTANSSAAEVQQSFHQLARKFHPDRHMGQGERIGLLQDLSRRLTTAYQTLMDDEKRASYDKQLAATGALTPVQSKTESQEGVDECFTRAKQCLRAKDMSGSILWLRKCVAMAPAMAKYHAILARCLAEVPQYHQEAIQQFERAIELDDRNTSVYFQFAELCEVMRLPSSAIGLYRKILEIDPEHSKARERLREVEYALEGKHEGKDEKSDAFSSGLLHGKPPQTEFCPGPLAIPAQGTTELSSAQDMSILTASPSASFSEPQLEEIPIEPGEVEALQSSPSPSIKTNMVAHEVRVKATGAYPDQSAGEHELFTEETVSVLVFENGGVIQLSAAVAPGQLLFLANVETKREVVAQVQRKRTHKPTSCYVEVEFAEPAPGFWGMAFSAAAALLPKDPKETEAAALVISAEATSDEPGEPPPAPTVEEVQALKRKVEALWRQPKLMPTAAASQQAPVPAAVPHAFPPIALGDAPGTESNLNGGSDGAPDVVTVKSLPIEHHPVPTQLTMAEQVQLPKPSLDFTMSLPKAKRRLRAGGDFTPEFRGGVLRLALLTAALMVTAAGAAWYKHWIPWKSAAKRPSVSVPAIARNAKTSLPPGNQEAAKEHPEFSNANVASDPPMTSPGMPSQAAESSAPPFASSGTVAQPAVRKTSPSTPLAGKRATVRPTAKATSDPVVTSAVTSVVVPPVLIKSVRAVASLDVLRDFETGNVVIDAVVGTEGEVHFISVLSGPPSMRAAAVEAAKQYRYEPATRDGQPVPAHVNITIHFRFEP